MRSLIFGGSGMLGRAVTEEVERRGWPARALSHAEVDVTEVPLVCEWVREYAPQVIFNCAAFTKVDDCEGRRDHAFAVNGGAVGTLAIAARHVNALLVQVSTDYVFDGEANEPYVEGHPTAPLSVYGASKLRGEVRALEHGDALVVRTSWLFGPGGPNFVLTMLRLIEQGKVPLRVVDDQVGCPTYTPFLASALCDLAEKGARGVVHYRNREPVSWFGFTRAIVADWNDSVEVQPVTTAEFPRPARRPAYSVLAVDRYEALLGRRVEPWSDGLSAYLAGLRSGHPGRFDRN